ncbi:MCE family protein [Solicola gregarius]|uniref:MCE family protein n=1 Tax=Solicola gregarius TaxID=2908642 RepID=A0AA46TFP9_9ACTN|nr:MCE family protein [Solicola gregarius]UYM03728.1 MCE family protein [Solicola gregarius]
MTLSNTVRGLVLGLGVGLIVSSCGFSSVYDVPLPGGADVGANPTTLELEFRDVLDLVPQSAVKVDDVTVGKVTDIEMKDWDAIVTIEMRNSVELPSNATAEIRQTSILGEKFVSLESSDQPARDKLESGDTIPLSRTGRNPEIEEVLGALSMVLNGGGVAQLQTITREMNRIFDGREDEVKSVLRRLSKFMGDIDRQKPELVSALRKVDRLGRNANDQTDAIESALDDIPEAVRVLDDQRDAFVRMLGKLDRFSNVGTAVIRRSKADTIANLQDLAPLLRNLNRSGDSLVKSLRLLLTAPFPDSLVGETPREARAYDNGAFINASLTFNPEFEIAIDDMSPAERSRFVRSLDCGEYLLAPTAGCMQSRTAPSAPDAADGLGRLLLDGGAAE